MALFRTLMFEALRRLATDPRVQSKAAEVYRRDLAPRVRTAARRGEDLASRMRSELKETAGKAIPRDHPARAAGRLVGRLRRRYLREDPGE